MTENQELVEIVSQLPAQRVSYSNNGDEFQIDCVASATVKMDVIVDLFNQIRQRLPQIKYYDVWSDVCKVAPGPHGEVRVRWRAITLDGRIYMAELAKQIGLMMNKRLESPQALLNRIEGVPALIQRAEDVIRENNNRWTELGLADSATVSA